MEVASLPSSIPGENEKDRKGFVGTDGILVSDRPAGFIDPKTGVYF